MKSFPICLALLGAAAPALAGAYAQAVACDGCGETEYSAIALRNATRDGSVLVFDGANARLRKFSVTTSVSDGGAIVDRTARRVEPGQDEWSVFQHAVQVYEQIRYHRETCGPGGVGDWLVPDFNMELACEQHDLCYERGGDDEDRLACDQQLYLDMFYMGAPLQLATTYYLAVRAAGWMAFTYRGSFPTGTLNPLSGCNFLMVCDPWNDLAEMPG
jgi:hypothetical protein